MESATSEPFRAHSAAYAQRAHVVVEVIDDDVGDFPWQDWAWALCRSFELYDGWHVAIRGRLGRKMRSAGRELFNQDGDVRNAAWTWG